MIDFDAVAAWHLGVRGFGVDEWLQARRLHRHAEGRDEATGQGTVSWRLRPEMPPSGAWASTLTITVREDGTGHTIMNHIDLREATYIPKAAGAMHASLLLNSRLPETIVASLVGRTVGEVVNLPPVAHREILKAHVVRSDPTDDDWRVLISFEPVREQHETPFYLLP